MRYRIFLFLCFIFLYGCGYTTRAFIYKEDKIFIEPIVNKIDITSEGRRYSDYRTYPILLEKRLTNALINKFNVYGNLKVSNKKENSLLLDCSITNYDKEALRYSDQDNITEQKLRLTVHIKLFDSSGKILKEKDIVGETSFFLEGTNSKSETLAWEDLIDDTARRIFETIVEEWS